LIAWKDRPVFLARVQPRLQKVGQQKLAEGQMPKKDWSPLLARVACLRKSNEQAVAVNVCEARMKDLPDLVQPAAGLREDWIRVLEAREVLVKRQAQLPAGKASVCLRHHPALRDGESRDRGRHGGHFHLHA
jgi:hypothetical protein